MTQTQFILECTKRTIEPSVALENDNLCEALRNRDDDVVVEILDNEF